MLRDKLGELDVESSREEIVALLWLFIERIDVAQKESRGSKTAMLTIRWNPAHVGEVINKTTPEQKEPRKGLYWSVWA